MSANQKYVHCCPAWTLGPRQTHPKFGGGIIVGGINLVADRLIAIHEKFPDDFSSGHNFLEVRLDGVYESCNKPEATSCGWLCSGIEEKMFPKWSAFTSPAFALPGIENGAILNENPDIVSRAKAGHIAAIKRSWKFKKKNIGLGHTIWWPARDSRLHRGPLSKMSTEDAWEHLFEFWVSVARMVGDPGDGLFTMLLEYKPSVPGDLDFIPTMKAAIKFCLELNKRVGWKFMGINLEWAHALIGGETVEDATRAQLAAGLFGGLVHVNSAQLAMIRWDSPGTKILEGTPGDDSDWAVGEGGKERWNDQQTAVKFLLDSGIFITFEHDIDPAGEDPIECYTRSRDNLEKMISTVS